VARARTALTAAAERTPDVVQCRVAADSHDSPGSDASTDPDRSDDPSRDDDGGNSGLPSIVQCGALVLRSRASEVAPEYIGSRELRMLVEMMVEVMRAAPGVGLAAPQIGIPLRVLVMEERDDLLARSKPEDLAERERVPFETRVFVNPTLTPIGDEKVTFVEGCLSVSGFAGMVERYREVEISGVDEKGAPQTWRVRGWPARICQHEMDHLDGTLYIDRMFTRSFSTVDNAQAVFAGRSIAELRTLLKI
jgi:peptide deformylase